MACLCPQADFFNAVQDCVRSACADVYGADIEVYAGNAVAAAKAVCASKLDQDLESQKKSFG